MTRGGKDSQPPGVEEPLPTICDEAVVDPWFAEQTAGVRPRAWHLPAFRYANGPATDHNSQAVTAMASAATTHQKRNTPAATMYRSTRSVFVSTHSS